MIEVVIPTKDIIIEILEGLIHRRYSREEVVRWQHDVLEKYDYYGPGVFTVPLSPLDGYWEFVTFTVLKVRGIPDGNHEYFIRDEDLMEYLQVLKRIDCSEANGEIKRIRFFQTKPTEKKSFELIQYHDPERRTLQKSGVFYKRGIFENLGAYIETTLIEFRNATYLIDFYHDQFDGSVLVTGIPENKENLAHFLCAIGVNSSSIKWINEKLDDEKCELYRIDDHGNHFPMRAFESYVAAEIARFEYERKRHKQHYFLKRDTKQEG